MRRQIHFDCVPLREFAKIVRREVDIEPTQKYRTLGCRLYGEGVYQREIKIGAEIKAKRMFVVKENDFVINRIWAQKGSAGIVPSEISGSVVTQDFPVFALDSTKALPSYIAWYLKTQDFWEECRRHSHGTSGRQRLSPKELPNITFPLCGLREQRRIIARIEHFMVRIEEARRLRAEAVEKAEKILQAALQKVFVRTDEEGWEWVELKKVGKYINGRAFKGEEWETVGLPIIRIQNLTNPNAPFNYCSKPVKEKYYVKDGDLLISWSATLEVFAWNRGDAILNQHIFRVEANEKLIDKNFMFYAIKHVLRQIQEKIHGSAMKHITKREFENITIPLPSLEEQKRIVTYLDKIRETAKALDKLQQITKTELEKLSRAILDRAFKGEL